MMNCERFGRKLPWPNLLHIMCLVWVTESRPCTHRLHDVTSHKNVILTPLKGCLCTFWYMWKVAVSATPAVAGRDCGRPRRTCHHSQPTMKQCYQRTRCPSCSSLTLFYQGSILKGIQSIVQALMLCGCHTKQSQAVRWIDALHTPVAS
jgi:hypothetical protein